MSKSRVLFLCTGNSARSQMAEAFLREYGVESFEAHSAGLEPKPIHPLAIAVMNEAGIDISNQRSKPITEYLGKVHFGYVITVCANAEKQCPIFPGVTKRIYWPMDDPAAFEGTDEEKLNKFREIRDYLEGKIRGFIEEYRI
ncbi:arsenate reductase ArsC [bacterium]|nr:arsenate reductase ArsC [bacterium]